MLIVLLVIPPISPLLTSSPATNKSRPERRPHSKPIRSNLKVLVINFQGLRNKVADLNACIDENNPDVIIGTETHLNSSVTSNELFPSNYTVFRKDRNYGQSKGGVLIATKNDLLATYRPDLDSDCEVVWVSLEIQGAKQILIGSFYRSHKYGNSTDYLDQLRASLRSASKNKNGQIYLAGDFNLPDIDWSSRSVQPGSQYLDLSKCMLDICNEFGLDQMVSEPTRVNNILDIFLTTNPTLVDRSTLIPGISDHDGIPMIMISTRPKISSKERPRKVYSFHKADIHGIKLSFNTQKANILNEQFKKVFTRENDILPPVDSNTIPTMPDIEVSLEGVVKLLKELNPNKASGPDGIPAHILKLAAEEVAPALCSIFQKSLDTGVLPSSWLCANISPVFKKGDRSLASNYRPVSLTSICCKVLEHIIHSQIMGHFDNYSVITNRQHGFRQRHSCESQLILTTNDLVQSLDHRSQTDMIIMDFSKAFHTVPHNRLLCKLQNYGIKSHTLTWISNFLKLRKQRVVVGGDFSDWVDVISGVPQGTVLGPLLFLVYINDLPDNISSEVRLFADDCVIYRQIKNNLDQVQLQKDLNNLSEWQNKWQMHFNTKMCFSMRITHSRNPKLFHYTLDKDILESTASHTYLGVDISNNLTWNRHVNHITSSANRSLAFIRRNLYSCPRSVKANAYLTLVMQAFIGVFIFRDPYTVSLSNKVEQIQRRAARFVCTDYSPHSSVTEMLKDLGWDSLKVRRTVNRLAIFHKARLGLLALPMNNLQPVRRPYRHNHSNSFLHIPTNKDCYKYSFFPRTVRDWNLLPQNITDLEDPKQFKSAALRILRRDD
ncbi:RNA-directed DNA polymerase from mobile element jockey [Holothuria leucospilota]|uniref:RNA-directed DNA polymerase from mobile element jockey n=1 Tax=Holothuria leucospilota TaxID=206669 RepID=A0A9Q1HF43_HOLLE|nr:RNA-directed DNA polymerase from mobile element jockey [Holothuria leucospilota]